MSAVLGIVKNFANGLLESVWGVVDGLFPPEKRAAALAKLQAFAIENPKLAAFLLSNIALTGFPLFMFILFTLTVFVFSLVVALLVGILAALLFTVFMVGVALIVTLPTVFLSTMAACFLFLWGMGGYYILKWFNEGESPAAQGDAIGDKISKMTGGRLDFIMDGARQKASDGLVKPDGPAKAITDNSSHQNGATDKVGSATKATGADTGPAHKAPEKLHKKAGGTDEDK